MEAEARTGAPLGAIALLGIVLLFVFLQIGLQVSRAFASPGLSQASVGSGDPVSDRVSAIAAEFRVDESGAATYSIPVYGVPGTAGVAPQLSLNYSSQGAEGIMGKGWSVGGGSSITRCRATREAGDFIAGGVAVDGSPNAVDFSADDRFCLDGQRLVPAPAAAGQCVVVEGATVQVLHTEIESFQRVCAYAANGVGPTWVAFFTVERKDGSMSWYGDRDVYPVANRPDGYVNSTAPGLSDAAIAWAQTRFQDSTGNYIDYVYWKGHPAGADTIEHVLVEVRYTGKLQLPGQAEPSSAPYARVVLEHVQLPADQWDIGYQAGGKVARTHRLQAVSSWSGQDQARHYALAYAPSPSGNGMDTLQSVTECRDSSLQVCSAPTQFEWSGARHELATQESPANLNINLTAFISFKLADIDGDGRQDMVHLLAPGNGCAGSRVVTSLARFDPQGRPTFTPTGEICLPASIGPRGDGAWHVFDYNGDGRDDLFVSYQNEQPWRLHPSTGATFDAAQNLVEGIFVPSWNLRDYQVQVADLNGDGLVDILFPWNGTLRARITERINGGFGWGAERVVVVDPDSVEGPGGCDNEDGYYVRNCEKAISVFPTPKASFAQMADFNGDAASDLLFRVDWSVQYRRPPGPHCMPENPKVRYVPVEVAPGVRTTQYGRLPAASGVGKSFPEDPCYEYHTGTAIYAFVIDSVQPGLVTTANVGLMTVGDPWSIVFGDANGDGLTDMYVAATASSGWSYRINTGRGFGFGLSLPPGGTDPALTRFVDVNGDGRTDMVSLTPGSGARAYSVAYARGDGSYGPLQPIPGGNAWLCEAANCQVNQYAPIFGDIDGDGYVDFMSLRLQSVPSVLVSRAAEIQTPRDVIWRITNGLGATTQVTYAALTNRDIYRRSTGSRALNWGRGSPVSDFLAPMYVTSRAASSAPRWNQPDAMSTVHYRYANARVQAGGRGFLGFGEIMTVDANQTGGHVTTQTSYLQNFPFTGLPYQTTKRLIGGEYEIPGCLQGFVPEGCFSGPGQGFAPPTGSFFSNGYQSWEGDTDIASAQSTLFDQGVQGPVHVRTAGSDEQLRDPNTGNHTSRVLTAFTYAGFGNVAQTSVQTYDGLDSLLSTVTTSNFYSQDNIAKWRLGRLSETVVNHARPGQADVQRRSRFAYAMGGPATGLLTEERVLPGGPASRDLRTAYQLDGYGNKVSSTTCSNEVGSCTPAGLEFRPASATKVHRYSRVVYDGLGRYPIATVEPFWNGSGASEWVTSTVISRNIFGDVTLAEDVNQVAKLAQSGQLGRPYYAWTQTASGVGPGDANGGVSSLTTYRWCGEVDCPAGARFREKVVTSGAPTQWSYFDVLGRPVMKAVETFNAGAPGQDVSASCSAYDAVGRAERMSNPFFLAGTGGSDGPTGLSGVCSAGRDWTRSQFDALGRPTATLAADGSEVHIAYLDNLTGTYNQRGFGVNQWRNALGESTLTLDAKGLLLANQYDATGNVIVVGRNVGRGDVANFFAYDILGRKTAQHDQDAGLSEYEYNALGELLVQKDASLQRTENRYDARGRLWSRVVRLADGTVETETTFGFDTVPYGLGQPASETIAGSYETWRTTPSRSHQFSRSYVYDVMGRPVGGTTFIDGVSYPAGVAYDALGRPARAQDASGQWAKTEFDVRGFARALCPSSATDASPTCAVAWQRTSATDHWGNVTAEWRSGSGAMTVTRSYFPLNGRLQRLCADKPGGGECDLVDEQYAWDPMGNLHTRLKAGRYLEGFEYDELDRLKQGKFLSLQGNQYTWETAPGSHASEYDALGNICAANGSNYTYTGRAGCGLGGSNSGSGNAGGDQFGAHRVSSTGGSFNYLYDARGNQTARVHTKLTAQGQNRRIRYSADDRPYELAKGTDAAPSKVIRFWYGSDGQRYKREDTGGKRTLYLGNVEVVIQGAQTTIKRAIGGFLLQTVENGLNNNRYLFHDQLGSLVTATDAVGAVLHALDYMPSGQRRSATNPQQGGGASPALTDRGFTGHEHLDDMDVIHMNGRIYDQTLGRFLQPDPVIQAPGNAQSWNAYTYVFNNPLSYTDPSGMISLRQILRIVVAAVVSYVTYGAASGWAAGWLAGTALAGNAVAIGAIAGSIAGFAGGAIATGTLKGGIQGAFSGLVFGGIGGYFGGNLSLGQVAASAGAGGVIESLQGGNFGHGFLAAGLTAAFMPHAGHRNAGVRAVRGALIGGAISAATGGKFANGAVSGAIQAAMAGAPDEGGISAEHQADIADQAAYNYDTALAWEFGDPLPQNLVDGVAGFGDTFGAGYIRRGLNIDGGIDYDSAVYTGGQIAGTFTPGLGTAATLRAGAYAGRSVRRLNQGRYWRIGPGVISKQAGAKPFNYGAGRNIPMLRVGNRPPSSWNHFDLRVLGR